MRRSQFKMFCDLSLAKDETSTNWYFSGIRVALSFFRCFLCFTSEDFTVLRIGELDIGRRRNGELDKADALKQAIASDEGSMLQRVLKCTIVVLISF